MKADKNLRILLRTATFAAAPLLATTAVAEYTLYEQGDNKLDLEFNIVGAQFMNSNSWFGESEAFLGADTEDWSELGTELGIGLETGLGNGTLFGKVSGVYTSTSGDDASGLTVGDTDADQLTLEQAHIGWRTSGLFSWLEDDTLTVSIGQQDYSIGTGMLIHDGGNDGGNRGGWYIGMRKAFKDTALVQLESKTLKAEAFRLRNNPRRGGLSGEAYGLNLEYTFPADITLGGTFMIVDPKLPDNDDLDVYDIRASWEMVSGLTLSGEFAREDNDQIESDGWYGQIAYAPPEMRWSPTFSYRLAHFDGDDPDTIKDEQFREIAYGFTDYGTWYQGEITGNYPLANANVDSHMLRVNMTPWEGVTVNLIYYNFSLDQKQIFGDPVSSDDFGDEFNLAVDWEATDRVYIIGVLGLLQPGDAAKEWVGGDDDWHYGMLYVSYSF